MVAARPHLPTQDSAKKYEGGNDAGGQEQSPAPANAMFWPAKKEAHGDRERDQVKGIASDGFVGTEMIHVERHANPNLIGVVRIDAEQADAMTD